MYKARGSFSRVLARFSARNALVPAVLLSMAGPAGAAVTFSYNYTDSAGVGFNANGQTGIDRRAGLADAGNRLASYFSAYNAVISLDVNGAVTNDNALASASSNSNSGFPGLGFGDRGDVMVKILGGADPAPALADGQINWNFEDFNWATGNTVGPGQYDLVSTAMHEITHALGFAAGVAQDGNDYWGHALGTASTWTPIDRYLADSSGSLINGSYEMAVSRWNVASVGGPNNGVFFNGPNAMAAFGGNPVPMYSPTTYEGGSSGGSHLDTDFFTGPNQNMMNHSGAPQGELDIRAYSAIELGILKDIGYTQITIPEPSSLMLLSAGTLLMIRRRRTA